MTLTLDTSLATVTLATVTLATVTLATVAWLLQGEEFEEGAEEIAAALEGFDARIEALRVRASRQAREVAAKRLEIQSMGDAHTREVARHGRLLAEKAAYDKAVQELDSCVADLAARLSLPLPGGPRAAGAAPPSLTPQAVLHFRQALAGKVEEKETALRQLKEANRRRDEEAAGLLDSFTRQTTRKQEELRLRRQQAQQNYSLKDSLAMQVGGWSGAGRGHRALQWQLIRDAQQRCEALVVNEHALNEAEQRLNEVSDALRSRTEEQVRPPWAVARLDEKLAREKREIDEVTARIAELRSERDKAAGANESVTRLRLKQAEIRQREDSLNALLRSKRAKLLHLLGSPAELPPLPALPAACDRALAALRSDHAERQRGMTELQAKESRLRGELASARLQAQSAEQHTERLRESLRAAAVSAGLPGLLLIGPGSPAGGSLATPGPFANLVGRHPGSSVDAQLLEREIETRKKAAERAASIHAQSSMLAKFLRSTASSFCTVNECPACKRPFNSEEERQSSLQAVEEELQALPARVEEMRTQQVAASAALDAVTALRPLALRVQEAEGASLQELRDRVANLEAAAASASASAQAEAEEVGMSGLELDEASRLVQEGVWQLDRAAKELQALREEVGRLETGLVAQTTDAAGGVQRSLGELDDALEELELSRQGKEAARESTLKRQARMREEVLVLTRDLSAAREQLTTAKTRMERKVELQTKIAELEANSAELLRSAAAMEAELAPLNQQREAQAAQRTTARSAMQAAEDREEGQLRGVRALADQLQAKVAPVEEYRARGQASDLADSTTSMRNMQDRMAALTQDCLELRRLEEQRGQLLDQIAGLEQEQGQAGGQAALEAQLQAAQAQVVQLTRQRDMLSGARATQQEVRNRAAQQLKVPQYNDIGLQYTQLYGEVMYSDMANADLEKYNKALEKALLVFHTTKMSDINKIVKELWQKTYRGQDIDYVQIKADADGARNYNYRVVMYNGGAELEMRGRCSAGQKVLACLIIRLALAETFCLNCGILALDKPTTNLDRENSASLAEALRAIMLARKEQENFQLIVITHDEAFAHQIGTREHADYLWRTRMPRDQAAMNRSTSAAVRIGVISASAVRLAIGAANMAHSSTGPSVAAPAMIEDPLVSAAYGISCWQSAAEAKVPEDAHEYYIRQSLNDSAYRTLAYTPYCACYPTCVKCERPQFMWKRKGA
ncbi:hypothetical protein QJQ45_017793 [Haematococcus lacustris]|nr:hypothetical protein QJQ45_017793 [Haematococcus lacustris]